MEVIENVVPDRGDVAQGISEGDRTPTEASVAGAHQPLNKPSDPDIVAAVEEMAMIAYEIADSRHSFYFYLEPGWWFQHPFKPNGSVKTWITTSRRSHPREWRTSEAVVLSYRGKKTQRFNVVVPSTNQAFSLEVGLKDGKLTWKRLETQLAETLKEAVVVAHR